MSIFNATPTVEFEPIFSIFSKESKATNINSVKIATESCYQSKIKCIVMHSKELVWQSSRCKFNATSIHVGVIKASHDRAI